jgi:hypothetical protein
LEPVALAVDRERRKELPEQIPFLVRLLPLVVVEGVVMDRAYKTVRMVALEAGRVGITTFKLLLDQEILQAHRHLREIMAVLLRRFKTTAGAVVALAR